MRVVCVIPARVGSTRLHEKPLQTLGDEPLIRLVARRAFFLGPADRVVVATDDSRVVAAVGGLPGVTGAMTSSTHQNGTERVAEIARSAELGAPVILNIQGDEPFVPTEAVTGVVRLVQNGVEIATAACPLRDSDLNDPSTVKVYLENGVATGFVRNIEDQRPRWSPGTKAGWARHLGVYAYTRSALIDWISLSPTSAETAQRLEQLRPLEHGRPIGVATINHPAPPGIDTPGDLVAAERYMETLFEKVGA